MNLFMSLTDQVMSGSGIWFFIMSSSSYVRVQVTFRSGKIYFFLAISKIKLLSYKLKIYLNVSKNLAQVLLHRIETRQKTKPRLDEHEQKGSGSFILPATLEKKAARKAVVAHIASISSVFSTLID